MSYPHTLGEFVAPFDRDEWPTMVQWNERRPQATRGLLNPWEIERTRVIWEKEKGLWPKIEALKGEYGARERQMRQDISIYNAHLSELERITKKKTGLGPIGTYGGMALAIVPGFGWASAIFSVFSMGLEILGGNKKKKRVHQLMRIMEEAQTRLVANQQRLQAIQAEMKDLMEVSEQVKRELDERKKSQLATLKRETEMLDERQSLKFMLRDQQLSAIRQASPVRVQYSDEI